MIRNALLRSIVNRWNGEELSMYSKLNCKLTSLDQEGKHVQFKSN